MDIPHILPQVRRFSAVAMTTSLSWLILWVQSAQAQVVEDKPLEVLVHADPARIPAWDRGVSPNQRKRARALFQQGNAKAYDYFFDEAAQKYREALRHWRHPGIYYNLSKAMIALGRPLVAYYYTESALAYGAKPLGADPAAAKHNYQRMVRQRERLKRQLAEIRIDRDHPSYAVHVDDKTIAADADRGHVVLPGKRRVVVERQDHRTLVSTLSLSRGDMRHYQLTSVRRMAPWKPWATVGAGTVLALAGGGLYWYARAERDDLGNRVRAQCPKPGGCLDPTTSEVRDEWRGVEWRQRVGAGALMVGGSALLIGTGLLIWNIKPSIRMKPVGAEARALVVTPAVGPGTAVLSGTVRF